MLLKRKILVLILIAILAGITACGMVGKGIKVPKLSKKTGIYIETDIKPTARFEEAKIKSVSILKFDAKYVRTKHGKIVDYIYISNKFTDNLLKRFYEIGKIDVALGEYEDRIIETDILEKKRGDIEIQGSMLKRSIEFKATPYKKIESIMSGRINKYQQGQDWNKSFIEITLKLTDTYSGAIYWITDMRGYMKDVTETIVQSVNKGKYTEPLPVKKEEPGKGRGKEEEKIEE